MVFPDAPGSPSDHAIARAQPAAAAAPARLDFDAVYAEHFELIWRTLRRHGVREAAIDDAVQDTLVVIHRQLASFEGRSRVSTWVYGIALRVAKDHRRRDRRKPAGDALEDVVLADPGVGPFDETSRREAQRIFERLLDAMDDDKRDVFVLAEIEQLDVASMAALLGVNRHTLASRVRAARAEYERVLALWQRRSR